jgi:hypothetical protein
MDSLDTEPARQSQVQVHFLVDSSLEAELRLPEEKRSLLVPTDVRRYGEFCHSARSGLNLWTGEDDTLDRSSTKTGWTITNMVFRIEPNS